MNQQTIDMLTEMKMTAMAAEFANQIQDASFNSIGFEERLSMLVTAEWNRRQNNKVDRLMHNAEFGILSAMQVFIFREITSKESFYALFIPFIFVFIFR